MNSTHVHVLVGAILFCKNDIEASYQSSPLAWMCFCVCFSEKLLSFKNISQRKINEWKRQIN